LEGVARAAERRGSRERPLNVQLLIRDTDFTDRLVAFLRSVGQRPLVNGPGQIEVDAPGDELNAYLRVWQVMHPDVDVELSS
jgi:hypothetical protein